MSKHSALNYFGRSGNPAFRNHFDNSQTASNTSVRNPSYQNHLEANQSLSEGTMSLDGTVNKTGILLALCVGGAFFGWNAPGLALPAAIIGFVIALFTIIRPKNSPYTAPSLCCN
jgi:Predicted membrane protein